MSAKNILKTALLLSSLIFSNFSFAMENINYENEGPLLFKIKGFYSNVKSKPSKFAAEYDAKTKPGSIIASSFGLEGGVTYFFADHFATELGVGLNYLKVSNKELNNVAKNLGDGSITTTKNNDLFMIPVTVTAQYHIAPFGAIRPYIGGGFHGSYVTTPSKNISLEGGFGPVAQIGVDIVAKDDSFFTIDIKQYFMQSKMTFKKALLGPETDPTIKDITSKVKLNPLILSIGFGFKF